jgi:hypothetical protein
MEDLDRDKTIDTPSAKSRRVFIKGVIGSGAAAFSAAQPVPDVGGPGRVARTGRRERVASHAERQRAAASRRREHAGDARDDPPLQAGPHRDEAWLRLGGVRRLHGSHRRCADGNLNPVQRAVVDEQGFQCAFCRFPMLPEIKRATSHA